ncbi:MAG: phosphoribosylformylglycinamidine synthase [Chitinivibrionia bacterium]|nr:phosphoribosylformylglycinamidine synthase [Chitinivibrionia bacterium]
MVTRLLVEKKREFAVKSAALLEEIRNYLKITALENIRIIVRYDIEGMKKEDIEKAKPVIFYEPPVDILYEEIYPINDEETAFATEYLPGQYDQRADSAAQAMQLLCYGELPTIRCAQIYVLKGELTTKEINLIKDYLLNPVDSQLAHQRKPATLIPKFEEPADVEIVEGFTHCTLEKLEEFHKERGLAMSKEDLISVQKYFKAIERRDPTITEIKVLDTYWSDHCRHTTFRTKFSSVAIGGGTDAKKYGSTIRNAYRNYISLREEVHSDDVNSSPQSLMDVATIGHKYLRVNGFVNDVEETEEVNACSIEVEAEFEDGRKEPWLVMFKNETHNHPTEIEPLGGASTCLGGCIRDPLSGRSYVYQAMRITGSADPRKPIQETIKGKLPQRKITTEAAVGYSSYGNQIGVATGLVNEIYNENYVAKRMELGAVIAAAPKVNVFRGKPEHNDVIVLIGGKTGRDGCGGATGSSKSHTEKSIETSGAEVQKGNAPMERKIQRLFRNPEFSQKIKLCNDFGAGGVSVAIGEMAPGMIIDLDTIPKKYEGLDGTELAISESQERMAICIAPNDLNTIIRLAAEENLNAVKVATVSIQESPRMKMIWRGKTIVNMRRDFLNTNGVGQEVEVSSISPKVETRRDGGFWTPFNIAPANLPFKERWIATLKDLNVCIQRGLTEHFDSTVGAGTVLHPFGGKTMSTPAQTMVAKLPAIDGDIKTATIMAHSFDADVANWSPFHGAVFAVIDTIAKTIATGGDYKNIKFTFQEYYEKMTFDPQKATENAQKWGRPLAALLGALLIQLELKIPAIGGKDSMSGTFGEISVPPTFVPFAVSTVSAEYVISPEFKAAGNDVYLLRLSDKAGMMPEKVSYDSLPDFDKLRDYYSKITGLIREKKVVAAHTVGKGGVLTALSKMALGNRIGVDITASFDELDWFASSYGEIVLECTEEITEINENDLVHIGKTIENAQIVIMDDRYTTIKMSLDEIQTALEAPLESVFATKAKEPNIAVPTISSEVKSPKAKASTTTASPRVYMPVFPGTNCEYDTSRQFKNAGATVSMQIINNLSSENIVKSVERSIEEIKNSQIIVIPGGFSAGDEPDGSGKFIASYFRNPAIADAVMDLIKNRDGLILGICNGFQALVKLGLVPYGEIRPLDETSPTLTYNYIHRHISQMITTRVSSTLSPWFAGVKVGDTHTIPVSHGEGRFAASEFWLKTLEKSGQIAAQYVNPNTNEATNKLPFNPNGSIWAIEALTSPDGRVLGKMGHSERFGKYVGINIHGNKDQKIFESGVNYFK